jgi:hypothetical protein
LQWSHKDQNIILPLSKLELQYAAVKLRTSYSHALETLFSLLIATIQSPTCPYAWVRLYSPWQLRDIVNRINQFNEFPNYWNEKLITWEWLSSIVHRNLVLSDKEKNSEIVKKFGFFWQRLARELINDDFTHEYNSIKHGFRIKPGGFSFAFGKQDSRGVKAKPENMHLLGRSEFGSSFLSYKEIGEKNYQFFRKFRNWNPEAMLCSLRLISFSISNVVSNLMILGGKNPENIKFTWPTHLESFDKPSELDMKVGVKSMTIENSLPDELIQHFTVDEMKERYLSGKAQLFYTTSIKSK